MKKTRLEKIGIELEPNTITVVDWYEYPFLTVGHDIEVVPMGKYFTALEKFKASDGTSSIIFTDKEGNEHEYTFDDYIYGLDEIRFLNSLKN